MSAPSLACSRYAEPQRGAAVVLAMLTVSFAAIVASAAMADFGLSIEAVQGRRDQAQSRQLARAAVDWSRAILAQDERDSATDHARENWAVKIPPTQISDDPRDGTVGGEIIDVSGRFNLNDLAPAGRTDAAACLRLQRLLENLGEPAQSARRLSLAAAAWIATGTRAEGDTAPHAPLVVADEITRIPDFDPLLVARLTPFVAALPTPSRINVNTAAPEVLSALVPGLNLDAARVLAAERERAWFRNLADLAQRLPEGATSPGAQLADVRSRHFLVVIHAGFGTAVTRLEALLDRRERWPELLWYRLP